MRIAILLRDENFTDEYVVQAYAFTVDENTAVSIGSELMTVKNLEYFIIWLIGRDIDIVFADFDEDEIDNALRILGIKIRSLKEIKDNPLLNQFLIKDSSD